MLNYRTEIVKGKKRCVSIILYFFMACMACIIVSCGESDESITEPSHYTFENIQSYADLFEVFWNTMHSKYNDFYEEKRFNNLDLDVVYDEYCPKFQALKSWNPKGFDMGTIRNDSQKAEKYFDEIMFSLLDKHFTFEVLLPISKYKLGVKRFTSHKKEVNVYDKGMAMEHVFNNKLQNNAFHISSQKLEIIGGFLASNPDIYYLSFDTFSLNELTIDLKRKNLLASPDMVGSSCLEYESTDGLQNISSDEFRGIVDDIQHELFDIWKENLSVDIQPRHEFKEAIDTFNDIGVLDTFLKEEAELYLSGLYYLDNGITVNLNFVDALLDLFFSKKQEFLKRFGKVDYDIATNLIMGDFINSTIKELNLCFNFDNYVNSLHALSSDDADLYFHFYNLLIKGKIKKLILDFRGIGEGNVIDFRHFVERLVTKEAVFAHLRHMEKSNGKYRYRSWVPQATKPHKFAIKNSIPIVVLTDRASFNMSELSTLMLKSQGSHVKLVGTYTGGGNTGLSKPDNLNGGLSDTIVGNAMWFYMPAMATKDMEGNVIEGIGIKPNVEVSPLTDEELKDIQNNPHHVDRTLKKAIELITSNNGQDKSVQYPRIDSLFAPQYPFENINNVGDMLPIRLNR